MGLFKIWKDHVTQYSNRYREVQNADGTITHEAVEGEVVQEGTPQNAQNFNDLEERVLSAGLIANLAMLKLGAAEGRIKGLQGEIVEATLVVEKNEGEKIAYDVSTTKIIFGDDDLMVNIKNRERDEEVTLDICKDTQDGLTVGVNTEAREYVEQFIIPARE